MVYREHALEVPDVVDDDLDRSLLSVDVSGRAGQRGADGAHGSWGASTGANGARGRAAGAAEAGHAAGTIAVHLAPAEEAPETRLVLTGRTSAGAVEQEVPMDVGGFIDLLAVGGRGGDGGVGGDGGGGAGGRSGSNATRHRSGGNGGPGGDGGDGGDGTSGARGGDGGSIEVSVGGDDTHLLMMIRSQVDGGVGGRPGVNGRGGAGGAGGRGGSRYTWTETEHYTDSQGKRRSRSRTRSNPGGSSGPSGRRGRDGDAVLHAGRDGPDGRFEIVVRGGGAERRYPDRYRPRLIGFSHASENHDGVYEPLERIEVSGLMVENVGGMPTPPNHEIDLVLESEGWVWPEESHLVLPAAIPAGGVTPVEGSLFFQVGDWLPEGPGEALEVTDHIVHGAMLPAAHRAFDGYHQTGDPKGRFVVRYPLRVSELECLHGLAPGEASRIRFRVENLSARAFGADSEVGRAVRFRLAPHGSELGAEHVTLLDGDDRPVPFEQGWVCELPSIGAGETLRFEGTVALDPSAPEYRSLTLWLSLELAPPAAPTTPRAIQHRAFEVRVAKRYRPVEGCELLLVTSHRTTRAQLDAWERLADRSGLRMAVWDVSLEGHLDLDRAVAGGTLRDQLTGGTVVVLDPPMQTAIGEVRPHRLLDRDQLRAIVDASISVAVFGGDEGEVPLGRWLVPDGDDDAPDTHRESAAVFRDALATLGGGGEAALRESLDVHHVGVWFEEPTEALLAERALALSTHLQDEYPHRRFLVEPTFAPELETSWGVVRRWKVGTLTVRSTFDAASTNVLHSSAVPEAEDLDGGSVEQVVLQARDFDEKLAEIADALRGGRDPWPHVRAALVDLVEEQRAILAAGWRRGLSGADMERAMPLLAKLVAHAPALGGPTLEQPGAASLIELAARLSYYTGAQPRWWEWALYPTRRAPRLRVATNDRLEAWIEAAFGEAGEAAWDAVEARLEALEKEREESDEDAPNERDFARVLSLAPVEWSGVTTDAELLTDATSRVLDAERMAKVREQDRGDDVVRGMVVKAQAGARERLLRPLRVDGAVEEPDEVELDADPREREREA